MADMPTTPETITILTDGQTIASNAGSASALTSSETQKIGQSLRNYETSGNKLLDASSELLVLCATISRLDRPQDINAARAEISRSIIELKHKVVQLDYPPSTADDL